MTIDHLDGLGMLVNQGVISLKYWTGIDADPAVMRKTVAGILGVRVHAAVLKWTGTSYE
jgi:shikimate 5-dehydrogenase